MSSTEITREMQSAETDDILPPMDIKTLETISEQVWEAIQRLPALRERLIATSETAIFNLPTAEEIQRIRGQTVSQTARPVDEVVEEALQIFASRTAVGHPRFFSAIPSPASPVSWLGDVLTSAFNAFSGAWEAGPGLATVEISLIEWLACQVGFPASAGGQFVSGGSIANLSAMTVARDHCLRDDERTNGIAYISDQTHFCVAKGLRITGLLDRQIRKIASDSLFRMDTVELENAINADLEKGLVPFLIVASCGTTNTGSIDPLNVIADLARKYGMWMHVDGAYGASVALSLKHKSLLAGLERADSLAWDAHKWLFQTYGCATVLVRNKLHLGESFAATAEYLRDVLHGEDSPNLFNYGIELTRPARHMRLWFSLHVFGSQTLGQMIDHGFMLAETMEAELRALPDWEISSPATLAIVSFRYCPNTMSDDELDRANAAISRELIARNIAAIATTVLRGRVSLRICSINPFTKKSDMQEIVRELNDIACKHLQSISAEKSLE